MTHWPISVISSQIADCSYCHATIEHFDALHKHGRGAQVVEIIAS